MIKFELNRQVGRVKLEPMLKKLAKVVFKEFKKSGTISIATVESKESKKLNKAYRGKNKPADVLTFIYKDEDDLLGEIVLSYNEVKERARSSLKAMKGTAKKEKKIMTEATIYLIIHGICHIFGYGHKTKKDALIMEEKENNIMGKLRYNI